MTNLEQALNPETLHAVAGIGRDYPEAVAQGKRDAAAALRAAGYRILTPDETVIEVGRGQ